MKNEYLRRRSDWKVWSGIALPMHADDDHRYAFVGVRLWHPLPFSFAPSLPS